jgi:hypothetical protein
MTNFHNRLALRAAAAVLALSLAACVPGKVAEPAAGPTWRTVGPPGKSVRIRVNAKDNDVARDSEAVAEPAPQA